MAITRHSTFDKTVQTIFDRNAIVNKVNHMTVVVVDAIADPNAGKGKAVYRWDATDNTWILISKSTTETMNFVTEELTITNGEISLSYIPVDNIVWNTVILSGQLIYGDLNLSQVVVSGGKITGIDTAFNGYNLRVSYAYGTIAQQVSTVIENTVTDALANGIKTINGSSILGTGNIVVEGVLPDFKTINGSSIVGTGDIQIVTDISGKADKATTIAGYGITDAYTKTEVESKIVELSPPTDISMKADITYVDSKITDIINLAPATLDTLGEIATQLTADEGAVASLTSIVSNKVDKISGKGLSTEDYTTAEKTKLAGIEVNANNYVLPVASSTVLGGVKAGTNISIDANGVISANDTSVAWSEITSKPSTLSGYGITDGQNTLVSGNNIKTINGTSVLGSGNIDTTQTTITGNAGTATKLQTARTIAGVSFDGSINIDIPYANLTGLPTIPTVPTNISSFTNDSGYQTSAQVNTAIQAVVGAAPAALDTLAEIATQLANDESAVSALTNVVSGKVDKVAGFGLSSNDYTTAEKTKLSGLSNYSLPVASSTVLGGVKAGTNISIDANGVISANDTSVAWSEITSKPTTLSGYGITDSIQSTLVSGTSIKTINGTSILGSGDIVTTQTTITGNAGTATKLQTARTINGVSFDGSANINVNTVNSEVIKFDTGTTEGTDLYTFNGSSAKTIDIKAGTNVTLTKAAGSITISANDTSVAIGEITGLGTGISTFLATPTSANLLGAVTDETGTGSLVFATSPTLVTPNIGVATGTSFNNITALSSTTPLIAGTAAIGTSTTVARADHVHPVQTSVTGNAGTATTLQTSRTIGTSGDVTGTATSFNGSANITIPMTLANSGVTAGTYNSVTVDAKGRVTSGSNPTTLSGYGITDAYTKSATDNAISTAVANLVNSAPSTLDTLGEIANQLSNDESAINSLYTVIGTKANSSDVYLKAEIDAMVSNIGSTEFNTGNKRGGKVVYGIEVDLGTLPNSASKDISFTFNSSYTYWIDASNSYSASSSTTISLPCVGFIGDEVGIKLDRANNKITVIAAGDRSSFTSSKLVLLYTK